MHALIAFIVLSLLSAVCFVGGAYLLGGAGIAMVVLGLCALAGAIFMSRGIGHG